jgi:hypothetical protein
VNWVGKSTLETSVGGNAKPEVWHCQSCLEPLTTLVCPKILSLSKPNALIVMLAATGYGTILERLKHLTLPGCDGKDTT